MAAEKRAMGGTKIDRWWKPKATNLLAVLYSIALVTALPFSRAFLLFVPSVLTIFGIGTFGHLINDRYDVDTDGAVGKPNALAGVSGAEQLALFLATLTVALAPWWILPWDHWSASLLALEFALLVAYAVPPVRLKERYVWPILVDGAYAYAVPSVLAAYTFFLAARRRPNPIGLAALFIWQLSLGSRHFLNHIALDRRNDLATGTTTLATRNGARFIQRLIRKVVLPVELSAFIVYLVFLGKSRWLLPVVCAALFLTSCAFHIVITVGREYPIFQYRFSRTNLDSFYQDMLPLVLLSFLTGADWRFGFVLLGHVLLFSKYGGTLTGREAIARLLARAAPQSANCPASTPIRRPSAAAAANVDTASEALAIAVVNVNKRKYTETFIDESIPRLRHRVYYLHGGELPHFDDEDRHFLSRLPRLRSFATFLESILGLEPDVFLKNSIAGYFQAKDIRLVLAHFGPVGVKMAPIARDLGLPLIVCFHGYDAFHGDTLRRHSGEYKAMFEEADRIVGVSQAMLARLKELGAPDEKLVHLPAFVNLELFADSDHSEIGPRFLAVGRFAETKSPHLTILAFHRVARTLHDATLTLVGKGGGGELFEACVILVKSLGLDDKVEFLGVRSHEQVAMEMRRARVFVQHSVTTPEFGDMEGKPVAVMEAMASGLPVVSTRHPGIAELIEDQVTGLLVPEYDVCAMADAMLQLAASDELVRRIGRNASARIRADPLIANHVELLERMIRESIARN